MPTEMTPWVAILLVAAVTFLSRAAGPILMSRVEISDRVKRFLDAMSVSVMAALVASMLAQRGPREAVAVGISILVMMQFKSAVWAMIAGIGAAALWSAVFLG